MPGASLASARDALCTQRFTVSMPAAVVQATAESVEGAAALQAGLF